MQLHNIVKNVLIIVKLAKINLLVVIATTLISYSQMVSVIGAVLPALIKILMHNTVKNVLIIARPA